MRSKHNVPYVTKLQNIEDETTGDAFIAFKIKKTCNRVGIVYVPREQADDVKALFTFFKRKNADLPVEVAKAMSMISQA